ncbi:uncharacterized protein LOC131029284 isoform X1 [Cryptomeria japonica]|uniref:uncharacterized protein LOC131029284 isoform X1 n=1 Tax=Cryptomeria japonica TaxID=3369 RepID=UPI0027DA3E50|nr:uncharacterized protein LOC131029284 isoform X1 [Cryptomeria japonica]
MRRIIVSSNTWALCMRSFTTTHRRVWSNATVFHNRFTHTFPKGNNDKVTHSLKGRENLQLEDVNLVENTNKEFKKASKGGTQRFSTAAVMSVKPPDPPGPNTGDGPHHN